jgi:hypothetical protein
MILSPGMAEVPERSAPVVLTGRSFTITAERTIDDPDAEGVIFAPRLAPSSM